MGAPQLFFGLSLFLLIQIVPAWTTEEGHGLMMQEARTGTRNMLQMLLAWTSKGASVNAAGLQSSPLNYPSGRFSIQVRKRPKRHAWERPEDPECRLRSLLVRIKDLGLGYNSEETILFKYCSGSCPKARSNHDLTLLSLLQKSEILALGDLCCRPTHYEDVAFLDDNNQWHKVEKLSASACSCVG